MGGVPGWISEGSMSLTNVFVAVRSAVADFQVRCDTKVQNNGLSRNWTCMQ
jgi:hypothetical protein